MINGKAMVTDPSVMVQKSVKSEKLKDMITEAKIWASKWTWCFRSMCRNRIGKWTMGVPCTIRMHALSPIFPFWMQTMYWLRIYILVSPLPMLDFIQNSKSFDYKCLHIYLMTYQDISFQIVFIVLFSGTIYISSEENHTVQMKYSSSCLKHSNCRNTSFFTFLKWAIFFKGLH